MALPPNTNLGRYQLHSLLGAGGMGEVYLAQDTTLNRSVAVKLLPADFSNDKTSLARFKREAHAASSLNHPNILTIHEIGAEQGHHFIATEFIDGESLRQHTARMSIELREVLDIGIQVASALTAAHTAGIVHRDIKPENIMLRKDGIVKVLDFGLAKLIEQEGRTAVDAEAPTEALLNTEAGVVMGTVSYMSPEQARGIAQVDERTDIWSLGVVLYEMLAGRLPFEGQSKSDVMAAILKSDSPDLTSVAPNVPVELERIVTKALMKDREERYQGAKDLELDLKSLKQSLDAKPAPVTVPKPVPALIPRQTVVMALATLLLAFTGFAYFFYFAKSGETGIDSVAVLPFTNMTNDPDAEYLADGISESLTNSLSQLPQLKVIAQNSTFKYKGKEIDTQEVANALGVQAIVTGRIERRGDFLEISVNLIDARNKRQMWGDRYNRKASDLQIVQGEIARIISEKLRVKLTGAQEQQLAQRATENPEAYQLYVNGEFYSRKGTTEARKKALEYYNQAIALDPNFALAYVGVAGEYVYLGNVGALDPKETQAKAKTAAKKALELDDKLAHAHAMLGGIKIDEWDWPGAESEFKRALALNPNLANAHGMYLFYLTPMGQHTESLAEIKRAQELDPLNIKWRLFEGAALYNAHRFDEAIRQLLHVIELQPDVVYAHNFLGFSYAMKRMYAEAIAEYQKFSSTEGETTTIQIYLGYTYAVSGKREKALAILNKLQTTKEYVSPAELAILYAGLGDREAAFQSLERAYAAHDLQMQYLKVEPHYDSLRADPRFANLMQRVGLTP